VYVQAAEETTMSELTPIESLTYEQAFAELEAIVAALETDQRPLDEAIALFERGQALTQQCSRLLEQAELKVRLLSGDSLSDGSNGA
jgi:exodeoxyribonuclease VII small subunit